MKSNIGEQRDMNMKIIDYLNREYYGVKLYKYLTSVLLAGIMSVFILMQSTKLNLAMDKVFVAVVFSLIYLVALLILCRIKDLGLMPFLIMSAGLATVVFARVSLLSSVSMDYYNFIQEWITSMSTMTLDEAVVSEIGDYNLPYLYFLAVVSRFKQGWLVAVKSLSCIFDVILAYFVMKIVALKIENNKIRALVFVLTLAVPTMLLNSAFWGQCDSIYAAFCLGSIYFALKNRGTKSMIMFAFAFALKLQAIFIIPFLLVCLLLKKIDWFSLIYVPMIYIICMFPAIVCGRGLYDSLFIYIRQASQVQYNELTLNAPSIWALLDTLPYSLFKWVGIMLAGLMALALVYLCYIYKDRVTTSNLVIVAYLSALMLPYFMPSMHDRYFFIADMLSVCVFFFDRRKWYVPLVTVYASFASYSNFLINEPDVYNLRIFSLALLVVMIIMSKELVERLSGKKILKNS